jgi:hypothetical protein
MTQVRVETTEELNKEGVKQQSRARQEKIHEVKGEEKTREGKRVVQE